MTKTLTLIGLIATLLCWGIGIGIFMMLNILDKRLNEILRERKYKKENET